MPCGEAVGLCSGRGSPLLAAQHLCKGIDPFWGVGEPHAGKNPCSKQASAKGWGADVWFVIVAGWSAFSWLARAVISLIWRDLAHSASFG